MKRFISSLFLFFLITFPVAAQTPVLSISPTPLATLTLRPIDVRLSTLEGMTYNIDGEELKSYADFHAVISPIKDYEAQRLIDRSQTTDDMGRILKLVGLLGAAGGIVSLATENSNSSQTASLLAILGGEATFDIGLLFGAESQSTKFNAVQRYNRFANGREQVVPQMPTDEKSLLSVPVPAAVAPVVPMHSNTPSPTPGVK